MKPKKGSAGLSNIQPIYIPSKFVSQNNNIQEILDKFKTESSIEEQQKLIKVLPEYLTIGADSDFIISLLSFIFLTLDLKNPIRKTILRILSTVDDTNVIAACSSNITYLIERANEEKEHKFIKQNEVVANIHGCFNNFPPGIVTISYTTDIVTSFAIDFFVEIVEYLSKDSTSQDEIHTSTIYGYIYNVTKLLVSVLQQCKVSKKLPDYCSKLMLTSYKVVMDEHISFDTKSNCGLLMVISVIHLPDHITNDNKYKTNPCLTLLRYDKPDDNDTQSFFNFQDITTNDTAKICIYSGILNIIPQNILCEEIIDDVPVISFMFGKLLECAKRCTGKPTQILEVSRTLILISKIMNTIPLAYVEPIFGQGLDYVWTHLDHFVDNVKHAAKTIFENLIKLAYRHFIDGHTALLKMILTNMIDLLVNRCTHYVALTIVSAETGCSFLLDQFSHLPFILLINIADSTIAPQICNTYESLMAQHAKEEPDVDKWLELWVDLVKPLLTRSIPPVTAFYQRLLISAYKIQPLVLKSIMHYQWFSGANELGALIGCLRVARKSNLVVPLENITGLNNAEIKKRFWRELIDFEFLELMMCHQADEVRVSVLALVVESQKSTEIFTTWELNFLKKYFYYNVTTQSPNTRQQIVALYKKSLIKIKEGLAVLLRNNTAICNKLRSETTDDKKKSALEELQHYKKQEISYRVFTDTFFQEFLCMGLLPGCNYQRRSTCLELLLFIMSENCIAIDDFKKIWKTSDTINLLQMLCDTYEYNIMTASLLIKKMPQSLFEQFQSKDAIKVNLQSTLGLASAIKPTSTTSAGYILQVHLMSPYAREVMMEILPGKLDIEDTVVVAITLLAHVIEMGLKITEKNILEAARKAPCYGLILCIRHLIENEDLSNCKYWEYLIKKLIDLCMDISRIVSPIVNNSSPEGYLPMDNGLISCAESDETVTSQMVLVFAWRTVKEVSLLLGTLAAKVPDIDPKTGKELLTEDILSKIGEHFLNLFLETKHRGAYEQAYLGFCKFCMRLWHSNNRIYNTWPKTWLANILQILMGENENTFHKLCPTRRSAGLPFMIQAILVTEPQKTGNASFNDCMTSLLTIAGDTSEDTVKSRTHAMNILRALYRHNQLGEVVTPFVAQGVMVAVHGFGNDIWGVRNAATLLFATLMVRMFGVHRTRDLEELSLKNRMSARVFFMRYPDLSNFLLDQITEKTEGCQDSVTLHPILLILERLYPCNTQEESQLGVYIPYVTRCLSNCVSKIRELAAQALTSLIPNLKVVYYISELLRSLSDVTLSNNCVHGFLLQLMSLLKSLTKGYLPLDIVDVIEDTFWIFISAGKYISHSTAALYFDVVVLLTSVFHKNCQGALIFRKMVKILIWQSVKDSGCKEVLSTAKKKFRICRHNLHVHIISNLFHCDSYFKSLYLKELILTGLHSVHEEINIFCLNYINYLYFDHPKYVKHSLYISEQLEVSEREYKLITTLEPTIKEYVIESIHKDLEIKLFPVFFNLLEKSKECCLCIFLMLQHYPCVLNNIKQYKQEVLNFLLNWCNCDDDEMFCASLSAISTFLISLDETLMKQLNYSALLKLVIEASSPSCTQHQRISVAQFLVANKRLFCEKNYFISDDELAEVWNTVIILLEDDDQLVRDTISQLSTKDIKQITLRSDCELHVIAERAKEDLLDTCIEVLPSKISVPLLLSWALKCHSSVDEKESAELFDKGELNTYAEEEQLSKVALSMLKKLLWKLEDGLNYEDQSIFIEEHTLMVATNIYNILYQNIPIVINTDIRVTLLCVLKKILEYLEKCPINKRDFQIELERLLEHNCLYYCNNKRKSDITKNLNTVFKIGELIILPHLDRFGISYVILRPRLE